MDTSTRNGSAGTVQCECVRTGDDGISACVPQCCLHQLLPGWSSAVQQQDAR